MGNFNGKQGANGPDSLPPDSHLLNMDDLEEVHGHGHTFSVRDLSIIAATIAITFALYQYLPYEPKTNAGLAILFFAGAL
ncbi:MAG: hypothetical protein LBG69_00695 [Zoogloeaceae bacterium]|jgi:hypothetical protein|nr:hypothetical protein [Zoogloeaceae bacterium]